MDLRRLVRLLLKRQMTLSIAESCTGGLISHKLTTVSGVSAVFREGIVCYSNTSKIKRLEIPPKIITRFGAVSSHVCRLMAKNIVKNEKANIGLALTGIAGPTGGTKTKPIGLVYIGINFKNKILIKKYNFSGSRITIQRKSALAALKLLEQTVI
ncbi:MAG: CinA family protein [Planctomycetota bacterium]|nr:CinA family protein [Planctomycetota bacterium]MDI6787605.1 CinA family protein [Planctomycetota bacterium]